MVMFIGRNWACLAVWCGRWTEAHGPLTFDQTNEVIASQQKRWAALVERVGARNATIYEALQFKFQRDPTRAELKAEVDRIKAESLPKRSR